MFTKLRKKLAARRRRPAAARPALEALEDRLVPSAYTWEPLTGSHAFDDYRNWVDSNNDNPSVDWTPSSSDTLTFDSHSSGAECDINTSYASGTVNVLASYSGKIVVTNTTWEITSLVKLYGGEIDLNSSSSTASLKVDGFADWTGTAVNSVGGQGFLSFNSGSSVTVEGSGTITCSAAVLSYGDFFWDNTSGLSVGSSSYPCVLQFDKGGTATFNTHDTVSFLMGNGNIAVAANFGQPASMEVTGGTTISTTAGFAVSGAKLKVDGGAELDVGSFSVTGPGASVTLYCGSVVNVDGYSGTLRMTDGTLDVPCGAPGASTATLNGNLQLVNSDAYLFIGDGAAPSGTANFTTTLSVSGNFDCGGGTYRAYLSGWTAMGAGGGGGGGGAGGAGWNTTGVGGGGGGNYAGAELSVGGNVDVTNGAFALVYNGLTLPSSGQSFNVLGYGGTETGSWGGGVTYSTPWAMIWVGSDYVATYNGG